MRTIEEFKSEVYNRSNRQIKKMNNKIKFAVSGMPVIALVLVIAIIVNLVGKPGNIVSVQAADLMEGIERQPVEGKEADDKFINSQMDFSMELFQESVKVSGENNVLISPLSVTVSLAMTANGATDDTKSEMEAVLGGGITIEDINKYLYTYVNSLPSDYKSKLWMKNSIWIRDSVDVKKNFLQTNANYYGAFAYQGIFDDEMVAKMNDWVRKNSNGLMDKLMDNISEDQYAYLINFMFFDAEWEEKYPSIASYGQFNAYNGEKNATGYMSFEEDVYLDDGKATGFIKDYAGGRYSFVALLPNEGVDILEYVGEFSGRCYSDIMDNVEQCPVTAIIPKFSYEYEIDMSEVLEAMGIKAAFDSEKADFTGLGTFKEGNIAIGEVLQKTSIIVDEEGTKAGVVTEVIKSFSVLDKEHKIVELNRPFVYMIVDKQTNIPMFIGTVMNIL